MLSTLGLVLGSAGLVVALTACSAQAPTQPSLPSTPTTTVQTATLGKDQVAAKSSATLTAPEDARFDPAAAHLAMSEALKKVWSVQVQGQVRSAAGSSTLQVSVHERGGAGSLIAPGSSSNTAPPVRVEFARVNSDFYLRGDSAQAYQGLVAPDQIPRMVGRWIQLRTGDPRLKSLSDFTSLPTLLGWAQGVTFIQRSELTPGQISWSNPLTKASVMLNAQGAALPVQVRRDDNQVQAQLAYSQWNKPVNVQIPAQAEVTQLATAYN